MNSRLTTKLLLLAAVACGSTVRADVPSAARRGFYYVPQSAGKEVLELHAILVKLDYLKNKEKLDIPELRDIEKLFQKVAGGFASEVDLSKYAADAIGFDICTDKHSARRCIGILSYGEGLCTLKYAPHLCQGFQSVDSISREVVGARPGFGLCTLKFMPHLCKNGDEPYGVCVQSQRNPSVCPVDVTLGETLCLLSKKKWGASACLAERAAASDDAGFGVCTQFYSPVACQAITTLGAGICTWGSSNSPVVCERIATLGEGLCTIKHSPAACAAREIDDPWEGVCSYLVGKDGPTLCSHTDNAPPSIAYVGCVLKAIRRGENPRTCDHIR